MENHPPTTSNIAKKYGLILGGYTIVSGLMLFFLDMHYQNNKAVGLINLAVFIVAIVLGILEYKKANSGFIKLSEALKSGLGIALIAGLIAVVYSLLMMNYIDPEFMEKTYEFQKETLLAENPEMTVETVNNIIDMQKQFSGPLTTSAFILIFNLFFGFVIALIGGLIVRKSQPE